MFVIKLRNIIQYLILSIFLIFNSNFVLSDNKPVIRIYSVNINDFIKKEYNEILRNTISYALNEKNFIVEDGNLIDKYIKNSKELSAEDIISRAKLDQNTDAEIFIILNFSKLENFDTINLKINADIYNLNTKSLLTSWSTPTKIIYYEKKCNSVCMRLKTTENLILLSNRLGNNLGNILSLNFKNYNSSKDLLKKYKININGLNNNEVLSLTDLMTNEFPGFVKLIKKEQYGKKHKFIYYSSANNIKLKKWLIVALKQMKLFNQQNVELNINENLIFISKYPVNFLKGSKGNPLKYK